MIKDKPWGYENIWADCEFYLGKLIKIDAGHRLSLQYHDKKTESIFVIEGNLDLVIGSSIDSNDRKIVKLSPGESFHIPAGMIHRFSAPVNDVKLMEVSTRFPDDVVRIEDDYNRD